MFRLLLLCIMFTVYHVEAKHQKMNLQKALDLKLVKANATSLGGYQGFCMRIDLKNLGKDSLIVVIEAGRRLNSIDDENQDILIVQEQVIALRTLEEKSCDVKGYCCQSSNASPPKKAKYGVNKLADSNLVKVARYLSLNKFDKDAEQQSVWAVSDNQSVAKISSHNNDSSDLLLRQMIASIKGEKLPWYTIVSGTYVYVNGIISVFPLWLKGKMQYATDKDTYITLTVLNEKGQPVCLIQNQWFKASALSDYNLVLPIKGLAKGKYTIELKTPNKQLARKEFEI